MKSPYTRMYANENCVTQLQNDNAVEHWPGHIVLPHQALRPLSENSAYVQKVWAFA